VVVTSSVPLGAPIGRGGGASVARMGRSCAEAGVTAAGLADARVCVAARGRPIRSGRINLELRQQLPYRPLHSADWNVLFTLRTLVHDRDGGSIYDELLTVRPPARMTGGLQVRF